MTTRDFRNWWKASIRKVRLANNLEFWTFKIPIRESLPVPARHSQRVWAHLLAWMRPSQPRSVSNLLFCFQHKFARTCERIPPTVVADFLFEKRPTDQFFFSPNTY